MNYVLKAVLLTFAAVLLASCSTSNPQGEAAIFDPVTGKHPAGWAVATTGGRHPVVAANPADRGVCYECHGTDLKGGTSNVSCFTASRSGITCHANGPAPHGAKYPNHGAAVISNTAGFCLACHVDAANAPGSKPPGCQNCHVTSPVTTPSGCTSCHGKPPAAATYPNNAGVHAAHASLNVTQNATLTAVCDECHGGLGLGTLDHLERARARAASLLANPVVFSTLAKTDGLNPTFTAATGVCANTYCHGTSLEGFNLDPNVIRSPSWNTPFPVGTHCDKCHGTPPITGAHGSLPGLTECINCHPHVNSAGDGFTDPTKHINGIIDHTP